MAPSPPSQTANQMPPVGPSTPMPGNPQQPGGGAGFDPSQLPGVMQSMQEVQGACQKLASGLPPLAPFIAQFLSQLGVAVPNVIMAAGGGQGGAASPGGPPQLGGASAPGGGPSGMGVGAPPMPPQ